MSIFVKNWHSYIGAGIYGLIFPYIPFKIKRGLDMNLRKTLGENIVRYRTQAHMTQMQLASAAELSLSQLRHVEHGTGNTTVDVIERISHSLNVPPSDLFKS